jgi:hypothetical protein
MPFQLAEAVPWGRSFDEYVAMFGLSPHDLEARILGCGDGPASFNAELTKRGGRVVSIDPLYECRAGAIADRIREVTPVVLGQLRQNLDAFVWHHFDSVEAVAAARHESMTAFLEDYGGPDRGDRYVAGGLPSLPFASGRFDLALCSHFLFLYSEHFPLEFHLASLRELVRLAPDVRVFPLVELGGQRSRHVDAAIDALRADGLTVTGHRVEYEFQRGGNEMLVISGGREQGRGGSSQA